MNINKKMRILFTTVVFAGSLLLLGGNMNANAAAVINNSESTTKVTAEQAVNQNQIRIYYYGDKQYAHYKIGNGQWTNVPGIEMEKYYALSEYPYKITLDLGNEKDATVCFNDGNGNWDNNGGRDYKFTAGTYKVSNGNVTKMKVEDQIKLLGFECYNDRYNFVGGMIEFRAAATSINGNVYYTITAEKDGNVETLLSDSSEGKGLFIPKEPGTYSIKLSARDDLGNTLTKTMDFTVPGSESIKIFDFYCYNDRYNFVDGMIEFRAAATSVNGNVYYTITAEKDGKVQTLLSDSSEGKALFTPKEAGTYLLKLSVRDDKGNKVTKTMNFTVPGSEKNQVTVYYKGYDTPYMHYKIGNGSWTNVPGIKMEATNEKPGYTHKLTIDLGDSKDLTACFNNGNGSWDSKNGANYYFQEAGTYTYSNGSINKIK